CQQNYGIPFTF
nr:immunoglobulin light chain junction region [Macaca mulatta]MOW73032.1 immunoglobulin light chain junction region [Macaca mulatta]MOW73126.1 immunoglobulin light chain junction region [Macaca mulatta]MOW73378.1 immunoglobulin light chain junction region [Macaca mulatta]MOW73393.1 immunoglobulin light chain junction region [Macaca mulatta]